MKHRPQLDKTYKIYQGLAIGIIITVGILTVGTAIMTGLVLSGKLQFQMISIISMFILALSVFLGESISNRLIKGKYAIIDLIQAAIIFVLLIGINVFFFEEGFHDVLKTVFAIFVGTICACLTMTLPKKSRRKK